MEFLSVETVAGEFAGLAIMILHGDLALLDYLAIAPAQRGKGIGSFVLATLKERYQERRLLLEIEDPEEPCNNPEERIRRKGFYLRNGMKPMDYRVWLFGVKMLVLTHPSPVSYEEYHEIFDTVFSPATGKKVTKA